MRNAKFCLFVKKNTKHFRSKHFFCMFFKINNFHAKSICIERDRKAFCGWPTCNILFDQGICRSKYLFLGLVQSPDLVIPACEIWSNIFRAAIHLISEETKWAFTCALYFFYFIACTSFPWMFLHMETGKQRIQKKERKNYDELM